MKLSFAVSTNRSNSHSELEALRGHVGFSHSLAFHENPVSQECVSTTSSYDECCGSYQAASHDSSTAFVASDMNSMSFSHIEQTVLDIVGDLLDDDMFNPNHGSVAVEKVMYAVSRRCSFILMLVLQGQTFDDLIAAHPDMFHIWAVTPTKKRMRSVHHRNWRAADARNRTQRRSNNARVETFLVEYLRTQPDHSSTVNGFIAAYRQLECSALSEGRSLPSLPKRGDLVRLVRYRSHIFDFNDAARVIRLLPERLGVLGDSQSPLPSFPQLPEHPATNDVDPSIHLARSDDSNDDPIETASVRDSLSFSHMEQTVLDIVGHLLDDDAHMTYHGDPMLALSSGTTPTALVLPSHGPTTPPPSGLSLLQQPTGALLDGTSHIASVTPRAIPQPHPKLHSTNAKSVASKVSTIHPNPHAAPFVPRLHREKELPVDEQPKDTPLLVNTDGSLCRIVDFRPPRQHVRSPSDEDKGTSCQPCAYCGKESTLECSNCANLQRRGINVPSTFFCSFEHQQKVWKRHHEAVHRNHAVLNLQNGAAVPPVANDWTANELSISLSQTLTLDHHLC